MDVVVHLIVDVVGVEALVGVVVAGAVRYLWMSDCFLEKSKKLVVLIFVFSLPLFFVSWSLIFLFCSRCAPAVVVTVYLSSCRV